MINEMDTQYRNVVLNNISLQNELTHVKGILNNCVSREAYESKCRECEMKDAQVKAAEEENASIKKERDAYRDEVSASRARESRLEKRVRELEEENSRLRKKDFTPSSERMDEDDDRIELPENKVGVLAMLAGLKHEAEKIFGKNREEPDSEDSKKPSGKDRGERKHRCPSSHKVGVYTDDVAEALGIDKAGMPANATMLMRKGKPDTWIFRVLYMRWIRVYSKEYTIGRFYNPETKGLDNTAYPAGIHDRCHLSPSFVAFYLRMKISYNVSEQNIIRALEAAGCNIPQPTLNEHIQEAEKTIREFLQPAMVDEIKDTRFTHNDETRLRVKSPDGKTGAVAYRNEYVHGILSPSAKLLLLLYDEGSRGHVVQEKIMRDSKTECFVCDKAKMYPKIVKDIINALDREIIRGSCWVHWRRDIFELARHDKRFKPILDALRILFGFERKWREKDLNEQERLEKRQELSRPVVDYIFALLRDMLSKSGEYGTDAVKVINYLLSDEDAFRAFLCHGLMEIDNNAIERCFRHIAMGRRTWLFTGSHAAAENLAFMYSLEESCKMNGLDFGDYIEYVMERMVAGERDARSLLPNHIQIPSDWIPEGQLESPSQEKIA